MLRSPIRNRLRQLQPYRRTAEVVAKGVGGGIVASVPADMARRAFVRARARRNYNSPRNNMPKDVKIKRRKFKSKRKAFKPKRKSFRSTAKSFSRRVRNVAMNLQPWHVNHYRASVKLWSDTQETLYWGADVGLGSFITAVNAPLLWLPGGNGGDIFAGVQSLTGLTSTTMERDVVWKSTLHMTIKNQSNFGCYLKVYYITTPRGLSASITNQDTINEIMRVYYAGGANSGDGSVSTIETQASDIVENPGISKFLHVTSRRMIKFMPGETRTFKIKASQLTPGVFSRQVWRTRNNATRTILFQATSFPVHNPTGGPTSDVGAGAVHLDLVSLHKFKCRISTDHVNTATGSKTTVNIGPGEGQQYQKGELANQT